MALIRLGFPQLTDSDIKRFWSHVEIKGDSNCWNWNGMKDVGYGLFRIVDKTRKRGKRIIRSHQVSYFLSTNNWPVGFCVCHSCDNPSCCNPKHLWIGTDKDNARDRNKKGRVASGCRNGRSTKPHSTARGESHPKAKLTVEEVLEIRRLCQSEGASLKIIGSKFGVMASTVYNIMKKNIWKHI